MVDQIIRPWDLPNRPSPNSSEKIPVDNGSTVGGATVESIVLSGRPTASKEEAEAGSDAIKAMTPLTSKQALVAQGTALFASQSQGVLAETAVQQADVGTAAYEDVGYFATSEQGAKADTSVQEVIQGENISIDNSDPSRPIVSYLGSAIPDGSITDIKIAPDSILHNRMTGFVDVRDFGAIPDDAWNGTTILTNGTDSTTAIRNAIAYAIANKIGIVYAPGKYRITDTLVMDTGVYTQSISLQGDGSTSRIRNTGAQDAIHFSTTQFLKNSSIKNIEIYCMATAGHGINIKYGCTVCRFENVNIAVLNPSKSTYFGDYSAFAVGDGGVFDTVWSGGDLSLPGDGSSTVAGFRFITNGTTFNENIVENIRPYYGGIVQFFSIVNNHTTSYLTNNTFRNINFEVCKGGGFVMASATGFLLQNLSFWDEDLYVNHLVDFVTGTGYDSTANTIMGMKRHGGTLASGVRDIYLQAANDTTVINLGTQASDIPSYNWNSKRVTVIGGVVSGELNPSQRNRVGALNVLPTMFSGTAYIDALHVGGFGTTDGSIINYSGGYTSVINQLASSGIKLEARNAANAARQAFLSGAAFFPLPDNTIALGDGSARWTVVYAATGAINTSDERSKQDIEAIPDEWLNAWGDVEFYRYKMRSAVEAKGSDARWHVGVVAQRIQDAFSARGIDAFEIGLLCLDKWNAKDAVIDEDGNTVSPSREAGEMFGVRYEEALVMESAFQRREIEKVKKMVQGK